MLGPAVRPTTRRPEVEVATVLLVRHSQASFGAEDYDVLSALGRRQAEVVAQRLAQIKGVRLVVHGSMQRQRDTATPFLAIHGDAVRCDARWDEFDHAVLMAALDAAERDRYQAAMAKSDDPNHVFQRWLDRALVCWVAGGGTDGEPFEAFRDRVHGALDDLLTELGPGGTAVVVSSAGVISAVAADLLGLHADGWLRLNRVMVNTSISKVVRGRSGTTLVSFNDHAHLEHRRELLTYR